MSFAVVLGALFWGKDIAQQLHGPLVGVAAGPETRLCPRNPSGQPCHTKHLSALELRDEQSAFDFRIERPEQAVY
jgi:hypothetical protein